MENYSRAVWFVETYAAMRYTSRSQSNKKNLKVCSLYRYIKLPLPVLISRLFFKNANASLIHINLLGNYLITYVILILFCKHCLWPSKGVAVNDSGLVIKQRKAFCRLRDHIWWWCHNWDLSNDIMNLYEYDAYQWEIILNTAVKYWFCGKCRLIQHYLS